MSSSVQGSATAVLRLDVLQAMTRTETVTVSLLRVALKVQAGQLKRVLEALSADGLIEEDGLGARREKLYRLTPAGREYIAAEVAKIAVATSDPQEAMWRTARNFREFTALDLSAWSSTEEVPISVELARRFCGILMRGGYVRVVRKAKPGVNEAIYMLTRNTGPRPPVEKRVAVIFDGNHGEAVHVPEVRA